jgi:hypothetical protein
MGDNVRGFRHAVATMTIEETIERPRSASRKAAPSKSFGVGCFHFQLANESDDDGIKPVPYATKVKEHLSQYPNVEEVTIEPYRFSSGLEFEAELDDEGDIAAGIGTYPCPMGWSFRFRLNIPLRLQREILEEGRCLETERIDVTLHYAGELPVAIVEGHDANLSDPSTAVVLVRRYLDQYSSQGTGVIFQYIGPSPFHADFFVHFSGPEGAADVEIVEQRGYDDINFVASSDLGTTQRADFVAAAHEGTAAELGVYYRIIQDRNRLNRSWSKLTDQIDQLVDDAIARRSWLAPKYMQGWRAKLDSAALDLVRFKLRVDEAVTGATEALDELAKKEAQDLLRRYADREVSQMRQYAVQDFSEMLSLLEKRSHAEATNVTVLVAALLGGLVGAVSTVVLGALLK